MAFIRSGGFRIILVLACLLAFGAGAGAFYLALQLPARSARTSSDVADYRARRSPSHVVDRNGKTHRACSTTSDGS